MLISFDENYIEIQMYCPLNKYVALSIWNNRISKSVASVYLLFSAIFISTKYLHNPNKQSLHCVWQLQAHNNMHGTFLLRKNLTYTYNNSQ